MTDPRAARADDQPTMSFKMNRRRPRDGSRY
jgi:hypothetical protein